MRNNMGLMFVGLVLLLLPRSVTSHHSFTAEYDSAKLMQFTGTVTTVSYTHLTLPTIYSV